MEDSYVLQIKERQFSDLYLCFCGYADCSAGHSFGPAVRPNYIIHYITEGRGSYTVDGVRYELEAGQGFLIQPGVQTFYQADESAPWSYLWVGFDGARAEEYLKGMGLGENRLIYRSSHGERLRRTVMDMLRHNTYTASDQFLLEGLLYAFFGVLAEDMDIVSSSEANAGSLYVRKAVEFIQNNYCNPIHITDVADYVCINRSYLYTLFQKELGMPPQEYLTNYRLTQAAELLAITDISIESVALSCGYSDPLVFSKAFKAKNGITPSQYRRKEKEEQKENLKKTETRLNAQEMLGRMKGL
ncbi:MAG TPA: AraC family transcriptional regulator [Candidatus Mediterraneibacter intestinavium]|nr:AraC family transcriptional regulator [Candidatus Mediterraneibacter intestinavium]